MDKNFDGDGIRKIRYIKNQDGPLVPDLPLVHNQNHAPNGHFTDFACYFFYCDGIVLKIPAINHIRMVRTPQRLFTGISSAFAAPSALLPIFAGNSALCFAGALSLGRLFLPGLFRLLYGFASRLCKAALLHGSSGGNFRHLAGNTHILLGGSALPGFLILDFHQGRNSKTLTEYLFQYPDQFRPLLLGRYTVFYSQTEFSLLRE